MTIEFDNEQVTDPAEAFEQMRRQLALLTAAVAGFASRQQVIEARDYAPDLAQIIERQGRFVEGLNTLATRPAMALTPKSLAEQIAQAGAAGRKADHQLFAAEAVRQQAASSMLEAIIGHAKTRQQQLDALIWAIMGGMIFVLMLWISTILLNTSSVDVEPVKQESALRPDRDRVHH